MKILYIDDSFADQLLFEKQAPEHDYTFLSQEPFDLDEKFDLIVLDVNMMPKSGYNIYSILRPKQDCVIILTTESLSNKVISMNGDDKIITKDKLFKDVKGFIKKYGIINRQGEN